jgi:hypothetical protein
LGFVISDGRRQPSEITYVRRQPSDIALFPTRYLRRLKAVGDKSLPSEIIYFRRFIPYVRRLWPSDISEFTVVIHQPPARINSLLPSSQGLERPSVRLRSGVRRLEARSFRRGYLHQAVRRAEYGARLHRSMHCQAFPPWSVPAGLLVRTTYYVLTASPPSLTRALGSTVRPKAVGSCCVDCLPTRTGITGTASEHRTLHHACRQRVPQRKRQIGNAGVIFQEGAVRYCRPVAVDV